MRRTTAAATMWKHLYRSDAPRPFPQTEAILSGLGRLTVRGHPLSFLPTYPIDSGLSRVDTLVGIRFRGEGAR